MKRLFRSYPVPLWIVALLVGACGFLASSNVTNNDRYEREIMWLRGQVAYLNELGVGYKNGRQYEAEKAGDLQAQLSVANGRLGPLQRKINEQQAQMDEQAQQIERLIEWLRGGFTGEIDMRPRQ